jgi:hypothetical protein
MKWRTLIFALLALSFITTLFAKPTKAEGGGQFGQTTLESIDGTGLVKLNGTIVEKEIHLLGSLISQNGVIGTLDIFGEANLTETTVEHGGSVMGSIQTVRSNIKHPITILSQKSVFTDSKLVGITIEQDSAFKGKQFIELRQGTIVDGPIHFKSGKGEVLIYTNSQVLGPVTGGKVIKK